MIVIRFLVGPVMGMGGVRLNVIGTFLKRLYVSEGGRNSGLWILWGRS